MEGILRVTPEQLESASTEFAAKGTTIGNLSSEMTQLAEGLAAVWEGEASAAYIGKFRQLDDDIQKMIRMVQEHANDLETMAKIYRDAENEVISNEIADLPGDVIV